MLCELAYRWFAPKGGLILDPFAGGSVRGIVASILGRRYVGIDLRPEQVKANEMQAKKICKGKEHPRPTWIVGDSRQVPMKGPFDFIFSCPPYADLEVYSDDPRDLSTMDYAAFSEAFALVIKRACAALKNDRFACFVMGDARGQDGNYYALPAHTIAHFEAAGLRLYNEAILVTACGSLPVRVGKQFTTSRKLGRTHQYVQIFVKGDAKKATEAIGEVEFGDIEAFAAKDKAAEAEAVT